MSYDLYLINIDPNNMKTGQSCRPKVLFNFNKLFTAKLTFLTEVFRSFLRIYRQTRQSYSSIEYGWSWQPNQSNIVLYVLTVMGGLILVFWMEYHVL